jgi:hypothetical protein
MAWAKPAALASLEGMIGCGEGKSFAARGANRVLSAADAPPEASSLMAITSVTGLATCPCLNLFFDAGRIAALSSN